MTPLPLETIRAMLAHLSPDTTREEWARVGMALKAELGEPGFDLFDEFSKRGEEYKAADVRSTWRSIKAGGGVTAGSLVHMAKAAGWRPDPGHTAPPAPSQAELKAAAQARREAADRERERQEVVQRERAAHAVELWALASAEGSAPYLERKGLKAAHGARFAPGGVLRVPMRDGAGELWNCQDILPEKMRDRTTGEPTTDKLYAAGKGGRKAGLFHLIGEPAGADVLLIGEGFATCGTAHEATGRPVAVAFDSGNLQPVAQALQRLYPGALLVVIGDNDRETEAATGRNPGIEGASKAARAVRGVVACPGGYELPGGGSDWNDAAAHLGVARVGELIEGAIAAARAARAPQPQQARQRTTRAQPGPSPAPAPENTPAGRDSRADAPDDDEATEHDPFTLDERGVWFNGFDQQGRPRPPMFVCGRLRVTARTRLRNGAGWGYLVELHDPERTAKEWVIANAALQGDGAEYRRTLADMGLRIGESRGAREKLAHYIQSRPVVTLARLVERAGWHGRLYVLPGRVFGESDERVILSPEATSEHPFKQRGTLDKWRASIGRVSNGNSRLAFAVSAAFAAPGWPAIGRAALRGAIQPGQVNDAACSGIGAGLPRDETLMAEHRQRCRIPRAASL